MSICNSKTKHQFLICTDNLKMEPNSVIPVYKTMCSSAPASLNLFLSQFQRTIKVDHFHFFSTRKNLVGIFYFLTSQWIASYKKSINLLFLKKFERKILSQSQIIDNFFLSFKKIIETIIPSRE